MKPDEQRGHMPLRGGLSDKVESDARGTCVGGIDGHPNGRGRGQRGLSGVSIDVSDGETRRLQVSMR